MNFDARKYVITAFILLVGGIYTIRLFYMQVIDVYEEAKYPFINGVMQEIEDSGYDKEEMLEYLIGELQNLEKQDRPMVTTSHKF